MFQKGQRRIFVLRWKCRYLLNASDRFYAIWASLRTKPINASVSKYAQNYRQMVFVVVVQCILCGDGLWHEPPGLGRYMVHAATPPTPPTPATLSLCLIPASASGP